MTHASRRLAAVVAVLGLCGTVAWAQNKEPLADDATRAERQFCEDRLDGQLWSRTELYFGLSRSGAPEITDDEFKAFLDAVVTPRFPDGLTLLTGNGQFRGSSGLIVQERTKLLILFYPWSNERHRAIERIRSAYKRDFQQEAVLRVDAESCVSF